MAAIINLLLRLHQLQRVQIQFGTDGERINQHIRQLFRRVRHCGFTRRFTGILPGVDIEDRGSFDIPPRLGLSNHGATTLLAIRHYGLNHRLDGRRALIIYLNG